MKWTKAQGGFAGYAHSASGLEVNAASTVKRLFQKHDADRDARLTASETTNALLPFAFSEIDDDRDGVLTEAEDRYVRDRPENFAGRWAAKEAVSKVLGLGVRGIGWRDIEIERLPTGQPAVRLHGRAAARAEQLGMERIAVSITHESDYAVAIAFGIRTAGGRYVFPLDIEERLDDREKRLLARMERLRELHEANSRLGDPEELATASPPLDPAVDPDGEPRG